MQFDDRLATVLRSTIGSEQAARTQYLQLLDLLGTAPPDAQSTTMDRAYLRLDELDEMIPPKERASLVGLSGSRLRDPRLVYRLSQSEPVVVSAAMSNARLSDSDWLDLIPQLPISARGFLRHGHHSDAVKDMLSRLGVGDMVLPQGDHASLELESTQTKGKRSKTPEKTATPNSEIGEIVRKIEAFRQAKGEAGQEAGSDRGSKSTDPRLPLGDRDITAAQFETRAFDFSTDANGRVIWADPAIAPMVYGMIFLDRRSSAPARPDPKTLEQLRRQQPVRGGTIQLAAAPAVSGLWQIDASPHFSKLTGAYAGYLGRLRRIPEATEPDIAEVDDPADRIRQLLHELRTPVNAIQGFSEVIQQQLFGPAPHEYRALAASIAGDAARMLAGFEEIDRLAQLEVNAFRPREGESDLLALTQASLQQVQPVLSTRNARFAFTKGKGPFEIGLQSDDAERMIWRIFAALSSSLAPGEQGKCSVRSNKKSVCLQLSLPASLIKRDDLFEAAIQENNQALSASAFGSGFALRLARAEAQASGGALFQKGNNLRLELPHAGQRETQDGDNSQSR